MIFLGDGLSVFSYIEKILSGRAEANVVGSLLCLSEVRGSSQIDVPWSGWVVRAAVHLLFEIW